MENTDKMQSEDALKSAKCGSCFERLPVELQRQVLEEVVRVKWRIKHSAPPQPRHSLVVLATLLSKHWSEYIWTIVPSYIVTVPPATKAGQWMLENYHRLGNALPGLEVWWQVLYSPPGPERTRLFFSLSSSALSKLKITNWMNLHYQPEVITYIASLPNLTALSLKDAGFGVRQLLRGPAPLRTLKLRTSSVEQTTSTTYLFPKAHWAKEFPGLTSLTLDTRAELNYGGLSMFPRLRVLKVHRHNFNYSGPAPVSSFIHVATVSPHVDWGHSKIQGYSAALTFAHPQTETSEIGRLVALGIWPDFRSVWKWLKRFYEIGIDKQLERLALLVNLFRVSAKLDEDLRAAIRSVLAQSECREPQIKYIFSEIVIPLINRIAEANAPLPPAETKRTAARQLLEPSPQDDGLIGHLGNIVQNVKEHSLDVWNESSIEMAEAMADSPQFNQILKHSPRLFIALLRADGAKIPGRRLQSMLRDWPPQLILEFHQELVGYFKSLWPVKDLFQLVEPLYTKKPKEFQRFKQDVIMFVASEQYDRMDEAWDATFVPNFRPVSPSTVDRTFAFGLLSYLMTQSDKPAPPYRDRLGFISQKLLWLLGPRVNSLPPLVDPRDGRSLLHVPIPPQEGIYGDLLFRMSLAHRDNLGRTGLHFLVAQASTDPLWAKAFNRYYWELLHNVPVDTVEEMFTATDYGGVGLVDYAPEAMRDAVRPLVDAQLAKCRSQLTYKLAKLKQSIENLVPVNRSW